MATRKPRFEQGETVVWSATSRRPDVKILDGPFRVERSDGHGGWTQWNVDNPYVYLIQPPDGVGPIQLIGEVALEKKGVKRMHTFTRYYQVIAEGEREARALLPEYVDDDNGSAWTLTSIVESRGCL